MFKALARHRVCAGSSEPSLLAKGWHRLEKYLNIQDSLNVLEN